MTLEGAEPAAGAGTSNNITRLVFSAPPSSPLSASKSCKRRHARGGHSILHTRRNHARFEDGKQ